MNLVNKAKNDINNMMDDVRQEYLRPSGDVDSRDSARARLRFSDLTTEEEELDEVTGSGSSGGYVAPMGWEDDTSHLTHKSLKEEEEVDEQTGGASAGDYSQPKIWAKNYKNWKAVQDPKFPKWGGPGGTYVRINPKCSKFPYCNQGDVNALEFYEEKTLKEAINNTSKRTGKSPKYLKQLILKELENKFREDLNNYRKDKMKKYRKKQTAEEVEEEIVRRTFYKSPITSLLGPETKLNAPIGKIFTMKGNKPKYE
jgi:hypothetical protein